MRVLHLDRNHPLLIEELEALGCTNEEAYAMTREELLKVLPDYDGIIVRSRIPIDTEILMANRNLKFIGRVGSGLENIDAALARSMNVFLAAAPEGNRNAVGEHALGMLLSLLNNLNKADREVRRGVWQREENRGYELDGQTVGIIGYGNTGKAFAQKLKGFDVEVICYDIIGGVEDENARQVGIMELKQKSDVISLHVPQTPETEGMVNAEFIDSFQKPFWFLNTARGKCVVTKDLVSGLNSGKVKGAALDVLEYESSSFERMFEDMEENALPEAFQYLISADNVILTPHIAGWTFESHRKLAQVLVDKLKARFW